MKFITLMLPALLCISCASVTTPKTTKLNVSEPIEMQLNKAELESLNEALTLAKKQKDFRLMATSGRSITIPGVKSSDYQAMIELCGTKYSSGTGDVITSENQRAERKKLVNYMKKYNEQILILCQKSNIK